MKFLLTVVFLICFVGCSTPNEVHKTDHLEISKLTDNTFIHTSYLQTNDFGKVPCNGLIYINENEAMVFDTPASEDASRELMEWIQTTQGATIKTVFVSHAHEDCLGGLAVFHEAGISSLATTETIRLAKESGKEIPTTGFTDQHTTKIGNQEVMSLFAGRGHTVDNSVSYIPQEKVLFGGCLIKALKANEGYVGEAVLPEWSATVLNVKNQFTDVQYIIPGHGRAGGVDLLEYTLELFNKYKQPKSN